MTRLTGQDCPNVESHTPCPDGYIQWHAWAQRMLKTHKQKRCPGCGFLKVWEPKKKESGGYVPMPVGRMANEVFSEYFRKSKVMRATRGRDDK